MSEEKALSPFHACPILSVASTILLLRSSMVSAKSVIASFAAAVFPFVFSRVMMCFIMASSTKPYCWFKLASALIGSLARREKSASAAFVSSPASPIARIDLAIFDIWSAVYFPVSFSWTRVSTDSAREAPALSATDFAASFSCCMEEKPAPPIKMSDLATLSNCWDELYAAPARRASKPTVPAIARLKVFSSPPARPSFSAASLVLLSPSAASLIPAADSDVSLLSSLNPNNASRKAWSIGLNPPKESFICPPCWSRIRNGDCRQLRSDIGKLRRKRAQRCAVLTNGDSSAPGSSFLPG